MLEDWRDHAVMVNTMTIMGRGKKTEFTSLRRISTELGENIRLARLCRKLSATMVTQRAGIARDHEITTRLSAWAAVSVF